MTDVQPTLSEGKTAGQDRRTALAKTGVWAFLCTDCDHPASDHRMRGDWRIGGPHVFDCRQDECGCSKSEGAEYVALSRAQWQTWLDRHPEWATDH